MDCKSKEVRECTEALDAFGTSVHVGDTVAFVRLSGYQKVLKGVVSKITEKSIIVTYSKNHYPEKRYVAPWGYVIKYVDEQKIYQKGYEDGKNRHNRHYQNPTTDC